MWSKSRLVKAVLASFGILVTFYGLRQLRDHSGQELHDSAAWARRSKETSTKSIQGIQGQLIPALRDMCQATAWTPGLIFVCDDIAGGIGNVAAFVLGCVRYAITAGAAMTMPEIEKRGDDLATLRESNFQPFDYMFDEDWFRGSLHLSCPDLMIYDNVGSIRNFHKAHVPDHIQTQRPDSFIEKYRDIKTFKKDILDLLQYKPSIQEPAIVRLAPAVFGWPAHSDTIKFYTSFGQILRLRRDMVDIADSILTKMEQQVELLHNGNTSQWIGAHLRTDSDVARFSNWPKYPEVRDAFLKIAEERKCKLIYVATGDKKHLDHFRKDAKAQGITVLTKFDLIEDEERIYLDNFSWDQQGLVDIHVLRPAPFLMGSSLSSFASLLAWSRHLEIQIEDFTWPEDAKSKLLGFQEPAFMNGMWPCSNL